MSVDLSDAAFAALAKSMGGSSLVHQGLRPAYGASFAAYLVTGQPMQVPLL